MSILLIGASGRSGRFVAQKLHRAGQPFRALIRNSAKSAEFESLGAVPVVADLTGDFSAAFDGVKTVIYTAGSAETEGAEQEQAIDRDAAIKAVDYAKQHGAERFVIVSTLLTDAPQRAPEAMRHYAQMKKESDDYVIGSGLAYLVLRPGVLTMDAATGTIGLVDDAHAARAPVAREDVADVLVEALQMGLSNCSIDFAGGDQPIRDALASLQSR